MLVSLNWLNEFVDLSDVDEKQIAHELTMSGLEVEEIIEVKAQFTNIVTAKIEKIDIDANGESDILNVRKTKKVFSKEVLYELRSRKYGLCN